VHGEVHGAATFNVLVFPVALALVTIYVSNIPALRPRRVAAF
jgi:hypothetical protein